MGVGVQLATNSIDTLAKISENVDNVEKAAQLAPFWIMQHRVSLWNCRVPFSRVYPTLLPDDSYRVEDDV